MIKFQVDLNLAIPIITLRPGLEAVQSVVSASASCILDLLLQIPLWTCLAQPTNPHSTQPSFQQSTLPSTQSSTQTTMKQNTCSLTHQPTKLLFRQFTTSTVKVGFYFFYITLNKPDVWGKNTEISKY